MLTSQEKIVTFQSELFNLADDVPRKVIVMCLLFVIMWLFAILGMTGSS